MERALEAHSRYLARMRETCAHHPPVHSHQLAALDRELAMSESAASIADYRARSGDLFELARAAWLDRAANQARVAIAVGDVWSARASAVEYTCAVDATSNDDWEQCTAAGGARSAGLRQRSAEASSSFTALLLSLLRLESGGPADCRTEAIGAHQALHTADPDFAWSGMSSRPCYHWRVPWTGPACDTVGGWIRELSPDVTRPAEAAPIAGDVAGDPLAAIADAEARWRSTLSHGVPGPAMQNEPTIDDVLAPYVELARSVTGDDSMSRAIRQAAGALIAAGASEPTPQDAAARFVSDGLLTGLAKAPLRTRAEDALARQALWPDPLVEHHWRALLHDLDRAHTPTEVDLIAAHAHACFAVEADWNALLLGSLMGPLRAACTFGWDGSEASRLGFEHAARTSYALLGLGPRRLLDIPRVAGVIARILVPLLPCDLDNLGAFHGEGGFDLLVAARAWTAMARAQGDQELLDEAGARAFHGLFDRARAEDPPTAPRPVILWGVFIQPGDLVSALAQPHRPPAPGMPN